MLSTIQRRSIQKAATSAKDGKHNLQSKFALGSNSSTKFLENLNRTFFVKRSLSYHLAQCEESFCHGYDLEKTCGLNGQPPRKLKPPNVCEMCYPQRKIPAIRHHCERRIEKEMWAFYAICALLGFSIVVVVLLYMFRGMGRRMRLRYRLFLSMRKNHPFAKRPVPRNKFSSVLSADSIPVPGLSSNDMDTTRRREDTATDDALCSMTFTMFQRKFNELGVVSRGYRKRIQDVFDIESLEPNPVEHEKNERVFVLPRAPNATVQGYPTRSSELTREEWHGNDHVEMESCQVETDHAVYAREQNGAV